MDQAGVNEGKKVKSKKVKTQVIRKLVKNGILIALATAFLAACGSAPPPAKTKTNPPPPIAPEAVKVEKPVNVSFSTYSTEWPVGWQWIDPDEKENPTTKDVKKGVLRVRIPNGKDLYGENLTAPRYVKPITGDFQIETRVRFMPKENYQGAGLLIYADNSRYLRFERAYGGVGGGGEGLRLDVRNRSDYRPLVTPDDIPTELGEVELKIVRAGTVFTAYWRENEDSSWREAGEYESDFPETVLAGLVACNTAREVTAEFGYIRLSPQAKP